ncbi:HD domain-containing protein [Bacillus lacus]|uniref:HD domain-containing protein n=1 Tax=Metabacillus lacus TaxID=1983721 RepID=A0A7X2J1K5_9BACI|nr:HD domain-containing protein [Metabacillus lacus]MRX73771.1 HD domain-containing protein [Metabacillus lacus]
MIKKAELAARRAHRGQIRKLTGESYFVHLQGVADILRRADFRQEVIAAGYLHDAAEDTDYNETIILLNFGADVAGLVNFNTEDKRLDWEDRKSATITKLKGASLEERALVAADKLDNLNSIISSYEIFGEDIWQHFKRGREQQQWYYKAIAAGIIKEDEVQPKFFKELSQKVNHFFRESI